MKISQIVLFIAILMITISSLSIVSAEMFDFLGGDSNNINGITFNIPDGFNRQDADNTTNSIKARFTKDNSIFTIEVFNPEPNITLEEFNNNNSNRFDHYQKKSINGHEGFLVPAKKRVFFTYLDDHQPVEINAPNEKFISQLFN